MLPRDSLSLTQVAATRAVLPVADPRQQAFQRAFAGQLGQTLQAEVLSRLDDGSFMVRVNDMAARMPLPPGAQPGQQVPLTLVAVTPRPTFQVDTGKGAAFAEAAPADGAHPGTGAQAAPLAYLEGKDAAALTRTGALLAQTRAMAAMPAGGGEGAGASLSSAGKLLGDVIAAAQRAGTQGAAAVAPAPLLAAPDGDAGRIAAALRDGIDKSGLFYESHVAEWAQGARTREALAGEPQARGMGAPTDPAAAGLINQQLTAQEQGRVAWQGALWPGQDMGWQIERLPPGADPTGGEHDASDPRGKSNDGDGAPWQSRLVLRFPGLGEVGARVVLAGDQVHIRLDAADADAGARLRAARSGLDDALAAAGTPLVTLAIHAVPVATAADADATAAAGPGAP